MLTEREAIAGVFARIARLSFPHDVSDEVYSRAASDAVDELENNPLQYARIGSAIGAIGAAELNEDDLSGRLLAAGDEPWFRDLRQLLLPGVYGDPEIWKLLGYEGPSYDLGGYIDRGFNDLDWLPEPRIDEPDEPLPEIISGGSDEAEAGR